MRLFYDYDTHLTPVLAPEHVPEADKKVKKVTDALANVSEAIDVDEYGDVVHNDSFENFWNVVYNTIKE